ncbi:hypothetical protein E2C01_029180 [Portunus trituberculatus]|uniref:Uncharacterized protein n=1 Tax=Portunus trituberculatus TaxID=210409 RepID=A0A5B7EQT4_PORTR|nr:hypothetical protein [Portunus trituberculatus]
MPCFKAVPGGIRTYAWKSARSHAHHLIHYATTSLKLLNKMSSSNNDDDCDQINHLKYSILTTNNTLQIGKVLGAWQLSH